MEKYIFKIIAAWKFFSVSMIGIVIMAGIVFLMYKLKIENHVFLVLPISIPPIAFILARILSISKVVVNIDNTGFHFENEKTFIFTSQFSAKYNWSQIKYWISEPAGYYYSFKITLIDNKVIKFYISTTSSYLSEYEMFLKAFNLHVSKYNESIEKNLAPIREGGSFYLKRIAIIYLIFFVLFIISFILFTIAEHKLTNMNIIAIIALSTMALSFGAKVIKARIKINKINR